MDKEYCKWRNRPVQVNIKLTLWVKQSRDIGIMRWNALCGGLKPVELYQEGSHGKRWKMIQHYECKRDFFYGKMKRRLKIIRRATQ